MELFTCKIRPLSCDFAWWPGSRGGYCSTSWKQVRQREKQLGSLCVVIDGGVCDFRHERTCISPDHELSLNHVRRKSPETGKGTHPNFTSSVLTRINLHPSILEIISTLK